MTKIAPFDAADYLDDEETIAEYITAALEDPNPDVFLTAVRDVARVRTPGSRRGRRGQANLVDRFGRRPILKLSHSVS